MLQSTAQLTHHLKGLEPSSSRLHSRFARSKSFISIFLSFPILLLPSSLPINLTHQHSRRKCEMRFLQVSLKLGTTQSHSTKTQRTIAHCFITLYIHFTYTLTTVAKLMYTQKTCTYIQMLYKSNNNYYCCLKLLFCLIL